MFAVGYQGHFTALSGGDMSITNSNSNFGNTALRSAGFKAKSFSKDKAGAITHIIPPKALNVISTTATGTSGANTITLANDGSVNGVIQGMTISGTNIASGATVGSVNTNTRVITLTANNTGTVNGNVIFGEETSVNWVNIDIQRTKTINAALAGQGGTPGTRLYLYGYTVEASPPTTRVQGFTVGARQDGTGSSAVADKLNCLLVANGATEATVQSASITPYGPSVSGVAAGTTGSPIQYDSTTYTIGGVANTVGGWYLSVSSTSNEIYTTLSTNTQYNTAGGFHGFEVSGSEKFRIDNTGHATISDGDLVIGTSGHGIDFSAAGNAGGMTSELLDDYEEGSFTPSLSNTGTISYSHQIGRYTKVGRQVHFIAYVRWNSRSNNGAYNITYSGLPFTSINVSNMNTPIYVGGSEGFSCNNSDRTHIGGSVHVNNTGGQFRVSNTMGGSEVSFHGQYGSTGAGYIYWGGSYYAS